MDAVLFDMDGVLVDSEAYWVDREAEYWAAITDAEPQVEEYAGMHVGEIYEALDEAHGVSVDREEFLAWYDDGATEIYGQRVRLLPGFRDLVADLRSRDCRVGLVTSSPPEWYGHVLDRFDLHGTFEVTVSAFDVDGPGKPAPDVYEHAADELEVEAGDCVAVEDSANGVAAALAAGMTCVGYPEGDAVAEAHRVASDPDELRSILLAVVDGVA